MPSSGEGSEPGVSLPSEPLPAAGEVHVWQTALDLGEVALARHLAVLSADEGARADRFRFGHDRAAFAAARAWLRTVLAAYLGAEPAGLRFGYGPDGKPDLGPHGTPVRFNLSHSGGRAALAVATGREVGIDIEAIRPVDPDIAGRFFAPGEIRTWSALTPGERLAAFFRCWARKEAYLKALGTGLGTTALDSFEVSLAPGDPPAVLAVDGDPRAAARWQVAEIDAGPGFAGAVAAPWTGWAVRARSGLPAR